MADITIVFMGFINQQTSLGGTILWGWNGKVMIFVSGKNTRFNWCELVRNLPLLGTNVENMVQDQCLVSTTRDTNINNMGLTINNVVM